MYARALSAVLLAACVAPDGERGDGGGDPRACEAVTCDAPPACFRLPGRCVDGACEYQRDDGRRCDDGDPCSDPDQCAYGFCVGQPVLCLTPPGPCLAGECHQGDCRYLPTPGAACDDGDPCTTGDRCGERGCSGTPSAACDGGAGD